MSDKQVDIILPVHNRLEHTRQTIDSLLKNTNPALYNLHIIDDASDDPEIAPLLESYMGKMPLVIRTNPESIGPGASRNEMALWITKLNNRSKYLYFSDNDVYFTYNWLDKMLELMEHIQKSRPEIKLLGGGCHPYLQDNSKTIFGLDSGNQYTVGYKDAVSGYSQLLTWETWDKFGPFDETTRGLDKKIAGSEDWAFCRKMVEAGFLVGSLQPEVVIHTGKTNTYGELATGSETFKSLEGIEIK